MRAHQRSGLPLLANIGEHIVAGLCGWWDRLAWLEFDGEVYGAQVFGKIGCDFVFVAGYGFDFDEGFVEVEEGQAFGCAGGGGA